MDKKKEQKYPFPQNHTPLPPHLPPSQSTLHGIFVLPMYTQDHSTPPVQDSHLLPLASYPGHIGEEEDFILLPHGLGMRLPLPLTAPSIIRKRSHRYPHTTTQLGGVCTGNFRKLNRGHMKMAKNPVSKS